MSRISSKHFATIIKALPLGITTLDMSQSCVDLGSCLALATHAPKSLETISISLGRSHRQDEIRQALECAEVLSKGIARLTNLTCFILSADPDVPPRIQEVLKQAWKAAGKTKHDGFNGIWDDEDYMTYVIRGDKLQEVLGCDEEDDPERKKELGAFRVISKTSCDVGSKKGELSNGMITWSDGDVWKRDTGLRFLEDKC